ncbi:MAG: tetratricopeptide repeat protein [Bacteroidales bacterium]|jgi:tetratricopeptide (TPR) repeat protein|nr:tetratricopeptide repeat protein [Bacteroidales bacterium]
MIKGLSLRAVLCIACLTLASASCFAQKDRSEVRKGNRDFGRSHWQNAEIDYKKGLLKDSMSVAGRYNLANDYYRMKQYDEAEKVFGALKDTMSNNGKWGASMFHNEGNSFLKKRDWGHAVDAYKDALRRNPGDMETKSNLAYAQKMLENQKKNGGGGQNDKNNKNNQNNKDNKNKQNQNQNQNNQNKNQNNNQSQNRDQKPQGGQGQPKISKEDVNQMLQAIDAKEKKTQDKVKKEKALLQKSKQKEKDW